MKNRIKNGNCRDFVENRLPFKGSNLFAEENELWYVVYSYGYRFPIYAYSKIKDRWFENIDKWSVSTSRHQTQARPIGCLIEQVSTEALKAMIK